MGCHTWFKRPVTKEEFQLMKDYALTEIDELTGYNQEFPEIQNDYMNNLLKKSFYDNIPCCDGFYWWELGYGSENPKLIEQNNGSFYTYAINGILYVTVNDFYDVFRLQNYPRKIIYNKRQLRRYLGSRYFLLNERQLKEVTRFWNKYPKGIICWG